MKIGSTPQPSATLCRLKRQPAGAPVTSTRQLGEGSPITAQSPRFTSWQQSDKENAEKKSSATKGMIYTGLAGGSLLIHLFFPGLISIATLPVTVYFFAKGASNFKTAYQSESQAIEKEEKEHHKQTEDRLLHDIDVAAQNIVAKMHKLYDEKPELKRSLDDFYGGKNHLPKADDLKLQFYNIAKAYLKEQQSGIKRLLRRPVDEMRALELTQFLLNVAVETGSFMAGGLKPAHIPVILKLVNHREESEGHLKEAQKALAEQRLMFATVQEQYKAQESETEAAKRRFVEVGKKTERDNREFVEAHQQYQASCDILKKVKERFDSCRQSTQVAESKIREMTRRIRKTQLELSNAIQFGTLGESHRKIDELLENGKKKAEDLQIADLIKETEINMLANTVEQQTSIPNEAELRADMALEALLHQSTHTLADIQPSTAQAKHTSR